MTALSVFSDVQRYVCKLAALLSLSLLGSFSGVNLPPKANIVADPIKGPSPLTVNFDASGSADNDGIIVKYEWDWDGMGTGPWDVDTGTAPIASFLYNAAGTFTAWVRVTDNEGAHAVASINVTVQGAAGDWMITTVATGAHQSYTSLVYVEPVVPHGFPAICYTEGGYPEEKLKFVRATDDIGSTWSVPVVVDATGFRGPTMAVVGGHLAISYLGRDLDGFVKARYVRATSAGGGEWAAPVKVGDAHHHSLGGRVSLAEIGGCISVYYYGHAIWPNAAYVQSTGANGSIWADPKIVGEEWEVHPYVDFCMAYVGGHPAICFVSGSSMWYARATDASGSAWGDPVEICSLEECRVPSMTVVNNHPAVSFGGNNPNQLLYVQAADSSGNTWYTPVTVDAASGSGTEPSLAVVGGNPAISYFDWTTEDLMYAQALDADGLTWETPVTVDTNGSWQVGRFSSLIDVQGQPAICYWAQPDSVIKYARRN